MPVRELRLDFEAKSTGTKLLSRREILSKAVEGNWATTFKGRGLEFTGYRPYTYSDDASLIDWKASLRSKELLIREFEEFKNFKVVFLLDVSNSMIFTSGDKFKAEYAAELTYSLSEAALASGDAVGLAMFSDGVVSSVMPSYGAGMKNRFKRLLSDPKSYGGTKDFKKSVLQLQSMLRDRTIIIVISDFLGLNEDWERYLVLLGSRHQLYGLMIKDRRDRQLQDSPGQYVVKDPNSNETMYFDALQYAKTYYQYNKDQETKVVKLFQKLRGSCLLIINESDATNAIKRFFSTQSKVVT